MELIVPLLAQEPAGATARWIAGELHIPSRTVDRALPELSRIRADEWNNRGIRSRRADAPQGDAIVRLHPILRVWYHHDHQKEVQRAARAVSHSWDEVRRAADTERSVQKVMRKRGVRFGYDFFVRRPNHPYRRKLEKEGVDFSTQEMFVRTFPRSELMRTQLGIVRRRGRPYTRDEIDEVWDKPMRLRDAIRDGKRNPDRDLH